VRISAPPPAAMASRIRRKWSSWTTPYRSPPSSWSNLVEPSMSVNRNVTVPVGMSATRVQPSMES
jgi:hypothetical protein